MAMVVTVVLDGRSLSAEASTGTANGTGKSSYGWIHVSGNDRAIHQPRQSGHVLCGWCCSVGSASPHEKLRKKSQPSPELRVHVIDHPSPVPRKRRQSKAREQPQVVSISASMSRSASSASERDVCDDWACQPSANHGLDARCVSVWCPRAPSQPTSTRASCCAAAAHVCVSDHGAAVNSASLPVVGGCGWRWWRSLDTLRADYIIW